MKVGGLSGLHVYLLYIVFKNQFIAKRFFSENLDISKGLE